jgi:ribonuclease R
LVVAIADVATYVPSGSALDVDALRRCTSVYFPDRVLPMLPERLSNGLCSLMPNVERLCLVADLIIDGAGQTRKTEIYPAVMRSAARCTYTQVASSLGGEAVALPARVTERFPAMRELAQTLHKMREGRGAIDFNLTELKIMLGSDGRLADVVPRERNEAHRLIESFMLAANEAVASHFLRLSRPSIFRVHDQPNVEKLESFLELARAHGFQSPLGQTPRPQTLNAFLRKLDVGAGEKPKPEARALNALLLRSMMQAAYAEHNIGHYGLGATGYLHFTSPIRRYPDLMVHRLLWAEWQRQESPREEELSAVARRCSERERAAMSAEREIDSFYGALWASEHVGERFHGTIDGATALGLFVEIDGHLVSGLVSAQGLGAGAELEPKAHRFRLGRTGKTLGIGDSVEVDILSANVARRQIDLSLVGVPQAAMTRGSAPTRLLDRPAQRPGGRQQEKPRGQRESKGRSPQKRRGRGRRR